MTATSLGHDCHITLTHPSVNGGQPYGFLVNEEGGTRPGGVQITHQVDGWGSTLLWIYFDVILSDQSINPDGSAHTPTRAADYAMLLQYLSKQSDLILDTPVGAFVNCGAFGFTADERHTPLSSIVKCQINNVGYYWPPVDPDLLIQSLWGADVNPICLTWGTSYWR